ncbi:MAG: hypothetical protein WA020_11870 [Candidatus Acidiferrales bacterium]
MQAHRHAVIFLSLLFLALLACAHAGKAPLPDPSPAPAPAPTLDTYGGREDIPCTNTTGHFIVEKVSNRWWFCDPDGYVFTAMAVTLGPPATGQIDCTGNNVYSVVVAKYGDATYNWAWQTLQRVTQIVGFNSLGEDSGGDIFPQTTCSSCTWPGKVQPIPLPYFTEIKPTGYAGENHLGYLSEPIKEIIQGVNNTYYTSWRGDPLYDGFDPKLVTEVDDELVNGNHTDITGNSPYLLGVFHDDSDYFWGSGQGPDFYSGHGPTDANIGWLTLLTSPVQTYNPASFTEGWPSLYQQTTVYSKAQANNPSACSNTSPCSLRDYLWCEYTLCGSRSNATGIADLNAAWGSDYTSFDSTGTQVTAESVGTGDGSTVSFSHSLAHSPVSPFSVLVSIGGVAQLGDCSWMVAANYSATLCPKVAPAPPTLSYVAGGSLAATTYYVTASYVAPADGTTSTSVQESIAVPANNLLVVESPASWYTATGWNACVSNTSGGETYQNGGTPISIGTNWTEPTSGLVAGSSCTKNVTNWGTLNSLDDPSPMLTVDGTSGSTTITYVVVANLADGGTQTSLAEQTTTANTTLSSSNYVAVKTSSPRAAVASGSSSCAVYRLSTNGASPTTTGKIGTTACGSTLNDTGLAGDSTMPANTPVVANLSFVNYSTGHIGVTFAWAPASSAAITASYIYGGWMSGGTGLMDEYGANSWVGSNPFCVEGANSSYPTYFTCDGTINPVPNAAAAAGADLDNWIEEFSANYFKTMHTAIRAVSNVPDLGLDVFGSWGLPSFSRFMQGSQGYIDGAFVNLKPWHFIVGTSPSTAAFDAAYQYTTQYLGDVPLINFQGIYATADSDDYDATSGNPGGCSTNGGDPYNDFATQALRGKTWYDMVNTFLTTPTYNGDIQYAGIVWWVWQDFQGANQGVDSLYDNLYNGYEVQAPVVPCTSPLSSYNCGADLGSYGNAITGTNGIQAGNALWLGATSKPAAPSKSGVIWGARKQKQETVSGASANRK